MGQDPLPPSGSQSRRPQTLTLNAIQSRREEKRREEKRREEKRREEKRREEKRREENVGESSKRLRFKNGGAEYLFCFECS
jgi:hypothetical protein